MLSELVEGLRDIFGKTLIEIILYGSVAWHEESSESDIDVAVVINCSLSAEEGIVLWKAA